MKIVALSDTHGQESGVNIPEGDLIIHAGDYQTSRKSGLSFLEWYGGLNHPYKILVAGNHDSFLGQLGFDKAFKLCAELGIIYLEDTSIEIEGIKIHGSPWTPTFGSWNFMASERELADHWAKIPQDTQILVTHGPQHMVSDRVIESFGSSEYVGSWTLAKAITGLLNLKWHLFGHIHEGKRLTVNNTYTSVNLSILDHRYIMREKPYVFEIIKNE